MKFELEKVRCPRNLILSKVSPEFSEFCPEVNQKFVHTFVPTFDRYELKEFMPLDPAL